MKPIKEIKKYLPSFLSASLDNMDTNALVSLQEIRIRRGRQVVLIVSNSTYFIDQKGTLSNQPTSASLVTDCNCFEKIFLKMCDHSVYSRAEALKDGYVTLDCGARVGVCSSAIYENDLLVTTNYVTSLNIRIPRQAVGCSKETLDKLSNCYKSILVAGPPNCGKTTLLRDMAYQLSNGYDNRFKKIVVVDSRNEFAGKQNNDFLLDVGANCDVLTGFKKVQGIEIAIRTLSPEIIVCDEIATIGELKKINFGFSCGVKFFLSVHIEKIEDIYKKDIVLKLKNTNELSHIIFLDGKSFVPHIIKLD